MPYRPAKSNKSPTAGKQRKSGKRIPLVRIGGRTAGLRYLPDASKTTAGTQRAFARGDYPGNPADGGTG